MDCVGLLILSAQRAGLDIEDEINYGREPWDDQLRRELVKRFGPPAPSPPHVGDVALIRWHRGEPSHIALIGNHPDGGLTLIHAHSLHGVVECSLASPFLECVLESYRPKWCNGVD